jgi:predicted ATPase
VNYLITGLSGAGKTTIGEALKERGYSVIEADTQLVRDGLQPWDLKPWMWDGRKVKQAVGQKHPGPLFVVGGAENQADFLHYFQRVFELVADRNLLNRRLNSREIAAAVRTIEHNVPRAVKINADRCVNDVVFQILRSIGA